MNTGEPKHQSLMFMLWQSFRLRIMTVRIRGTYIHIVYHIYTVYGLVVLPGQIGGPCERTEPRGTS